MRSYRSVLDRKATDPIRRDLKWLAGELGVERDHEVLRERLTSGVRELPGELVLGPVEARLKAWADRGPPPHARCARLAPLPEPAGGPEIPHRSATAARRQGSRRTRESYPSTAGTFLAARHRVPLSDLMFRSRVAEGRSDAPQRLPSPGGESSGSTPV
ncbi:CHAD domain-containing protein [Streptomyces sp. NPDC059371]|uniref:CHAD domain-containing protein n=1 Tax=Streptomyces sp. NPDC059371 TaxID=3346812 RepID=UPI00367B1072